MVDKISTPELKGEIDRLSERVESLEAHREANGSAIGIARLEERVDELMRKLDSVIEDLDVHRREMNFYTAQVKVNTHEVEELEDKKFDRDEAVAKFEGIDKVISFVQLAVAGSIVAVALAALLTSISKFLGG